MTREHRTGPQIGLAVESWFGCCVASNANAGSALATWSTCATKAVRGGSVFDAPRQARCTAQYNHDSKTQTMTTDDLNDIPHVVIVETPSGIRIAEFERDAKPSPMLAAHDYAQAVTRISFFGRIIVCARVRTIQPLEYANNSKPNVRG